MKQGESIMVEDVVFKLCRVKKEKAMVRVEAPQECRVEKLGRDPIPCNKES